MVHVNGFRVQRMRNNKETSSELLRVYTSAGVIKLSSAWPSVTQCLRGPTHNRANSAINSKDACLLLHVWWVFTKACIVCHLHASLDVNYLTERHSDVNELWNPLLKMVSYVSKEKCFKWLVMLSFELSFVCWSVIFVDQIKAMKMGRGW